MCFLCGYKNVHCFALMVLLLYLGASLLMDVVIFVFPWFVIIFFCTNMSPKIILFSIFIPFPKSNRLEQILKSFIEFTQNFAQFLRGGENSGGKIIFSPFFFQTLTFQLHRKNLGERIMYHPLSNPC